MGLPHEHSIPGCAKGVHGFMTTREAVFRECYTQVLNRTLRYSVCLCVFVLSLSVTL